MEQFRNLSLILMSLLLCFCFTEAQITQWSDGVNTNPPAGADANFTVTVAEGLGDTTAILTLTATATGTLASYIIETEPILGQFEIDDVGGAGTDGELTLAATKILDFETAAKIVIKVVAADENGSGTATLTICLTDVNEFTPTFTNPSSTPVYVIVPDKSTATTDVYNVAATDGDAGVTESVITYTIDSGNTDSDLTIDGSSGAITVNNALNKDRTPSYTLVVYATDAGADAALKTGSATIIVIVGSERSSEDSGAGSNTINFITLISSALLSLYALL